VWFTAGRALGGPVGILASLSFLSHPFVVIPAGAQLFLNSAGQNACRWGVRSYGALGIVEGNQQSP